MGQTKNFFKEKKKWSMMKDGILDYYLVPYSSKILRTGKPLIIFDCFAGKGKFDDGKNGSPLIIAEHIKTNLQKNPALGDKFIGIFIEKKYNDDLSDNLVGYPNTKVLEGTFEDNLQSILLADVSTNIFLYVDPYGIKSLSLDNFNHIKDKDFFSLEMLMNFNTAGFLREGCRLLKLEKPSEGFSDEDLVDYEADEDVNTKERMDSVAGGPYWQDVLNEYYSGKIDIYQAEDRFITRYSQKLKEIFKYTVNIPIKLRSSHLPKYRLIFCSNHEDGLILMADNMHKKWKEIVVNERGGQQVLFDFEFPNLTLSKGFDLHEDIIAVASAHPSGIPLKNLIVELIQKYGITFSESHYKKTIRGMETSNELLIERVPPLTKKTGKPAISMDYDEYMIVVRRKP